MSRNLTVVVLGGSGMIGSRVSARLRDRGVHVVAASRRTGIDLLTGAGLHEAMRGADAVVDVSDVPRFDRETLTTFFKQAAENVFAAERAARIKHHVTLSIVGTDRVFGNPYLDAKREQEELAVASGVDYTVARATQFFEFMPTLADAYSSGDEARFPASLFQPIAADDVAEALATIALAEPARGAVHIAGAERASFEHWFTRFFTLANDPRRAKTDAEATYFGGPLGADGITCATPEYTGSLGLDAWFKTESAMAALKHNRYAEATHEVTAHGS